MAIKLIQKHSLPTRVFHWINVIVLSIMIWSGILIYWAHDEYKIEIFGVTLITFFPAWFYENPLWNLDHRLAEGMAWHFAFAWLFALNGILYFVHWVISGEWREMVPTLRSFPEAFQVVLHDLGIRKEPLPPGKFNAAQRFAYCSVILMGAGSLVTGLAIYKPTQLAWIVSLLGGYPMARIIHFALTIGYVGFVFIHLAQVFRAGWNNFRSMVIGIELVTKE
jgi:thiosulfate reductase cytochrome b subunit